MSEYNLQVNVTYNGYLFNVNGESAEELDKHLAELAKLSPSVFENLSSIKQAGLAAAAFTANEASSTVTSTPAAEAGPPTEVRCTHGPMKDLQGMTTAKGEPYKFRYYCSAPKDDPTKCKSGKDA